MNSRSHGRAPDTSARLAALRILLSTEEAGVLTDETMERFIAKAGLDSRDRGLAIYLVHGVERYRATLDWRLNAVSDRPLDRLPLIVQMVLRLGAYQLIHMSKIPDSAAVNESVRLIKTAGKKLGRDWSGFTNAVLRSLTRTSPPEWPDIAHDPIQGLAVRYSCPAWLVKRWVERLGPPRAENWCRHTLEEPPLTLRVNRLHTTREAFLEQCRQTGYCANPTAVSPEGLSVEGHHTVESRALFDDGVFRFSSILSRAIECWTPALRREGKRLTWPHS